MNTADSRVCFYMTTLYSNHDKAKLLVAYNKIINLLLYSLALLAFLKWKSLLVGST